MSNVITFRADADRPQEQARDHAKGDAQIIIFPGIRYERCDTESAKRRSGRSG